MKVQKSIDIKATPDKIWPFFVEPEKVLQWCITFKKYEYNNKQYNGVGTPIYIEEQAGGPLMKMNFKITDCKDNEKLSLQMISGTGVKAYKQNWSLEPIPSGSRFTFQEEVTLPFGVIGKLLGSIMEGSSAANVGKMLAKLKSLSET
jgi:carbon monoxide dehydrogenase subunit G